MDGLTFDPASHEYRWHGVPVPSVTQILAATGYIDAGRYAPGAAEWGTYVHECSVLLDHGRLDWDALQGGEWVAARLREWETLRTYGYATIPEHTEERVYSEQHGYAGTVDRLLSHPTGLYLADIKTGGYAAWHPLQRAAYIMAHPRKAEIRGSIGVHLTGDGLRLRLDIGIADSMRRWLEALARYRQEQETAITKGNQNV